ncbi:MAG: FIST N-terminal domain-containing protein [Planctomycetota bacterium]
MPTLVLTALSDADTDRTAGVEAGAEVTCTLPESLSQRLALVFTTPGRDAGAVLGGVFSELPPMPVVGGTATLVFTGEHASERGVGLMVIASNQARFTAAHACGFAGHETRALGEISAQLRRQRGGAVQSYLHRTLLVFADSTPAGGQALVDRIGVEEGLRLNLAGITSPPLAVGSGRILAGRESLYDALAVAEILTDHPLGIGVAQGWELGEEVYRVTRSERSHVLELDGHPAAASWGCETGSAEAPSAGEAWSRGLAVLLPNGETRIHAWVRPQTDGSLECDVAIPAGSTVRFAERSAQRLAAGTGRAVEEAIMLSGATAGVAGLLVFECGASASDVRPAVDPFYPALGREALPLLGIQVPGAIARRERELCGFHGAAQVVCAFPGK